MAARIGPRFTASLNVFTWAFSLLRFVSWLKGGWKVVAKMVQFLTAADTVHVPVALDLAEICDMIWMFFVAGPLSVDELVLVIANLGGPWGCSQQLPVTAQKCECVENM